MAHVQRRERGGKVRWRARIPTPDGRERSKTFDRKVDAERWITEQEAARARGSWVDPAAGRITFEDWVEKWRRTLTGIRPTTRARKLSNVRAHLLPRFGSWRIADIAPTDVKEMVSDTLEAGLSAATARKLVFTLKGILEEAVVENRLMRNPCEGVKLPAEPTPDMRFLDASQVTELVAVQLPYYRPLAWTAAYVGLRWGELAGLKVEKVDLLRKTITIDQQLVSVSGHLSFGPPKTKSAVRTVTIPGSLVDILAEHFATDRVKSSGMAFPTKTGKLLRAPNYRRRWKTALERLGWVDGHPLAGLTFHELRHTAAALAIAQGAHPLTIKERLGHSSITVTMDRYGHLFPAQDQALAESLDGVLRASLEDGGRPGGQVADLDKRR